MTEAKIISFLSISPLTYQQIHEVSKIHKNSLGLRLQHLISQGLVKRHTYSIPYRFEFYGHMFKHAASYRRPLFGRTYYLLNCSRSDVIDYLSIYLVRREQEWIEDKKQGKISIKDVPTFCLARPVISFAERYLDETGKRDYFSPSETRERYKKAVDISMYFNRYLRELDLAMVKGRIKSDYNHPKLTENILVDLKRGVEFFVKRNFSLDDVLIRYSTEHTNIPGENYGSGDLSDIIRLPIFTYSTLWQGMERIGLFEGSNPAS